MAPRCTPVAPRSTPQVAHHSAPQLAHHSAPQIAPRSTPQVAHHSALQLARSPAPQLARSPALQLAGRLAPLLAVAACSAAHAEPPIAAPAQMSARIALAIAPPGLRAPYDVRILGDDGESLPTYRLRDRFYVQGAADQRYVIRITNPTPRRVEAIVSVDGLDAIDGENGDLRKRGYIVPAFGETRIEGFRTSLADVATFRFSSVSDSYAGQKGKARNVGVIAVALFEEQPPLPESEIVGDAPVPPPPPIPYRTEPGRAGRGASPADAAPESSRSASAGAPPRGAPSARAAAKRAEAPAAAPSAPATAGAASARSASAAAGGARPAWDDSSRELAPAAPSRARRERPGLGTEFGEQRYSAVSYTHFVRAPGRPIAIAELRYNDAAGLVALGVPVQPLPDPRELDLRETADPFPGDHFARPAR